VNIATLRLIQRDSVATTLIEEYTEIFTVMGIANLGGMWTMVSGTFVMVFGGTTLYFLSGQARQFPSPLMRTDDFFSRTAPALSSRSSAYFSPA
jgi:hypothetical protein